MKSKRKFRRGGREGGGGALERQKLKARLGCYTTHKKWTR
jgi:hypothetical protein